MNFIVFTSSYNEDCGGTIVLHKLCHMLNEMGCNAYLCPDKYDPARGVKVWFDNYFRFRKYKVHTEYNTPIATVPVLRDDFVAIYPETVEGNPLKCERVVRWLLHKPGYHTGVVDYQADELIFFFDENCIEPGLSIDIENKLSVLSINSAYKPGGSGVRSGSCYMMRKGVGRSLVHDTNDSVRLDGLSHQEVAAIFKKKKYFFSYDEFTLYSQYAALCGCISIVIPETFGSREEWVEKHPISKYGISYGLDDIQHAIDTQHEVSEYFDLLEKESFDSVTNFVKKTNAYYGAG